MLDALVPKVSIPAAPGPESPEHAWEALCQKAKQLPNPDPDANPPLSIEDIRRAALREWAAEQKRVDDERKRADEVQKRADDEKKRAEEVLQRSGITYTIVRPGGLLDQPRAGSTAEPIAMGPADAYGLPPRKSPGSILRSQVAEVCLAAVVDEGAENKTVEIVTESGATTPLAELFSKI